MAKIYKLCLDEGADNILRFRLLSNKLPMDLTGCSFTLQVTADVESEVPLLTITAVSAAPLTGVVEIPFTPLMTCAAAWTSAVYIVEMTDSLGKISRILVGAVNIIPGGICA